MALQLGIQLASSQTNNYLTDAKYVRGGYLVVDDISLIDSRWYDTGEGGVIVEGSLCYNKDDSKFYRYTGTGLGEGWEELKFSPDLDGKTITLNGSNQVSIYGFTAATTDQVPTKDASGNLVWKNVSGLIPDAVIPVTDNETIDVTQDTTDNTKYIISIKGKSTAADKSVLRKHINGNIVTYTWDAIYSSSEVDTLLNDKVDKTTTIAGVDLQDNITAAELRTGLNVADGATKVEASTNNGKIKINGTETTVYTEVANTVHDADYKHITVTSNSVSDGTNTFNKYDDTELDGRVTALEGTVGDSTSGLVKDVADLDGRLDIIEGGDTVDGSIKKAVKTEKDRAEAAEGALEDRIENLEGRGRSLSGWNATTGKPDTYPTIPDGATYPYTYTYKTGDYYIVSAVWTTNNKKPSGTGITKNSSSAEWTVPTATETDTVYVNDTYLYDGSNWTLIHATQKETAWGTITGSLENQTDLKNALDDKIEGVKVGDTSASVNNGIAEFEAEEAGALALKDEVSESDLDDTLATKINNKLNGVKIGSSNVTIDSNKNATIGLESELTYDGTNNKLKITRPSNANGQVLTAKSDGTLAWEEVGVGDQLLKTGAGAGFATYAEFSTAATSGTFYLAGGTQKTSSTITKGDYVIIAADEQHSGMQTRYGYKASAGSYQASNWAYEYSLGSAYTGGNGIDVSGTTISAKLDGTSLAATSSGLKINDGWTSGSALILNGGNAGLTNN